MDKIKVYDPAEDKFEYGAVWIKNPVHRKGDDPHRFKATNVKETELINKHLNNLAMEELNLFPDQKIKPMFDRDSYDIPIDTEYDIKLIKNLLGDNCIVKTAARPTRIKNGKTFYSKRYYVQNKRIRAFQLLDFINMRSEIPKNHFDLSKYGKGGQFYTLYNDKKLRGKDKDGKYQPPEVVPSLVPENDPEPNPLDYYATYVLEDYEDYDLKWEVMQVFKLIEKSNKEDKVVYKEDDEEVVVGKSTEIDDIIEHLKPERAHHYETWYKVPMAIINYGLKLKLSKKHIELLIHEFSKKSVPFYEEDKVDEWLTNNYDRIKDSDVKHKLGRNYLINVCLKEDDPKYWAEKYRYRDYKKVLVDFTQECVKVRMGSKWLILRNEDIYNPEPVLLYDKANLKHYFEHEEKFCYKSKDKEGKDIMITIVHPLSSYWTDTSIKCYDNVIYHPCPVDDISEKYFNTWTGWECMKYDACSESDEDVEIILRHLKEVWCDDNMELYEWWLDYLAYLVCGGRTGVVPIVRGTQGCGKDLFMTEFIMNKLLGEKYCFSTDDPVNQIFGKFNGGLLNKSYCVIEEGGYEINAVYNRIKKTATSDKLAIEKKFQEVINARNMANLIISTNSANLISGDKGMEQRRLMNIKCSDRYLNNVAYFKNYKKAIDNKGAVKNIYDMLVKRFKDKELDPENTMYLQNTKPDTQERRDTQEKNIPLTTQFLLDKMDMDMMKSNAETRINRTTLYQKYKSWCETRNIKCCDANSFYTNVVNVDGFQQVKVQGVRYMRINVVAKIRLLDYNVDDISEEELKEIEEWI